MRSIKRWWLLKHLRNNCWNHLVDQDMEDIKRGLQVGVLRNAYIETLKELPRNKHLDDKKLKKKVDEYNSIIDECRANNLIIQATGKNGIVGIKVSYLGDTFISEFWHKATWNNPIGTALVILVLSTITSLIISSTIAKSFQTQDKKIQQIQIIPYATGATIHP